jgi:hypothetical protein
MRLAAERRQLAEVTMIKDVERIALNGTGLGTLKIGPAGEVASRE